MFNELVLRKSTGIPRDQINIATAARINTPINTIAMPTRYSEQQALLKSGYSLPDGAEAGRLIKPSDPILTPGAHGPAIKPGFDFKKLLLIGGIILALILIFGRKR